jgi:hypothetical protein
VYTKWDTSDGNARDESLAHNRLLEVTMTYRQGELMLEYETLENNHPRPMPCRLLFLLLARPGSAAPHLRVAETLETAIPAAKSKEAFYAEAPVGTVRFSAPDGSAVRVVPELSMAERITVERPPQRRVARDKDSPYVLVPVKSANEGSLRLAFEGVNALDRGRYRIRFLPGA